MASQLLLGLIAFAPALLLLYFVVGAQEAFFRQQAMFVALIGGLVLGVLVAIVETFMLQDGSLLFLVVAFPLVETMAKTMLVGLPRFRKERETVLLGGATGAMLAAMLLTFYAQSLASEPVTWQLVAKLVAASLGFTGAHFVSGLRLGLGPAKGSILGGFLPSFGWLLPAHVLLGLIGLSPTGDAALRVVPLSGGWLEAVPLLVYGVGLFVWRTPGLIARGLPKQKRRKILRDQEP